jgi:cytochrome c2
MVIALLLCACHAPSTSEREQGKALLAAYGCIACHSIKGLPVNGRAGPPLGDIARNSYIAGVLPNNQDAMVRWIVAPTAISPGTAMPDLGVTPAQARAMAAYLYAQ